MSPARPLILLLMIDGVCGWGDWSVSYSPSHICALKGSTVTIKCTYSYPAGYQITEVFWTNTDISDFPDLSKDFTYSQRIEYLGDKDHNCSVKLTDVRLTDSQIYYFRFITDRPEGKWTGAPGVSLEITDLQVMSDAERVIEGRSVTLTCTSTCSLTDTSTFIWFRNTRTLNDTYNPQLILRSVRRENAGDYSCAVQRHKLTSPPRRLNVIYPPENTRVLVSHSGVIVEGDSVNLICRSESNPPAIISWFKGDTFAGSGEIYNITNIRSDHSGEYKCKTENELGVKYSDSVTLNVLYPPRNISASISSSGVIVEGDSVNLICRSESNPPANISWFKGDTFAGSGNIYNITNIRSDHSGEYKCKAINQHGVKYSDSVTLNVLYLPKNVSASISSSGVIVEGDSVNLTCRSGSNPPANISWFKENQTSSVGSGQMFSITNITPHHTQWFYCVAQNELGSQRSDAVSLTVKGRSNRVLFVIAGISAGCGGLIFILIIVFVWKCKQRPDDIRQKSDNLYSSVTEKVSEPEPRETEEIHYATISHFIVKDMKRSEETEDVYKNSPDQQHDTSERSDVHKMENHSVIYSTVKCK